MALGQNNAMPSGTKFRFGPYHQEMAATMRRILMPLLALAASYLMYYFSKLANDSPLVVSPQGCEMSWMWPHYTLHTAFNKTWTPLAGRYSLWLYREMDVDVMNGRSGTPVLFIPGNAGSSRQVRSIASSAARQFYHKSGIWGDTPLDFFTVEFNEDFSAIHPPTLLSQTQYSSQAIRYILSIYPKGTKIIIMGHSMGGTVAQLLLAELDDSIIRAVYTMSTPSLLSPVRFDRRAQTIYNTAKRVQSGKINSTTPLISICGGSTDSQITSEVCALPEMEIPLRRTIMTTSLEGAWTGVGHREMVWCHQVRALVARSALALAREKTTHESIDTILHTHPYPTRPSTSPVTLEAANLHYIRDTNRLDLGKLESGVYMLPLPKQQTLRFTLFAHNSRIDDFGSNSDRALEEGQIRILYCSQPPTSSVEPSCVKLAGKISTLPRQKWPGAFPDSKGVNDDDGLLMFEANVEAEVSAPDPHIAVQRAAQRAARWIVAEIENTEGLDSSVTTWDTMKPGGATFALPTWSKSARTIIRLPKLFSHALVIYRVETKYDGQCSAPRLPPLVVHSASIVESNYHTTSRPFYLQSHRDGPFIQPMDQGNHVPSLTILSTGECGVQSFTISLAWRETLARLGVRYWMGLAMWSVAVVGILQTVAWIAYDTEGKFRSTQSLTQDLFSRWMLPIGCLLVFLSTLPFPRSVLLGNGGQLILSILALPKWLFACGLVAASQYILVALTILFKGISKILRVKNEQEERSTSKRWIASIVFITILVATFVPFQVAFMVVFMAQLAACSVQPIPPASVRPSSPVTSSSPTPETWRRQETNQSANFHILLLLTWLLPFAAPILVVWIRTLQTAGYTVPFDGDHNILAILPWLLLGEAVASGRTFHREHTRWKRLVSYVLCGGISVTALLLGARFPYLVFEVATIFAGWLVLTRVQWRSLNV